MAERSASLANATFTHTIVVNLTAMQAEVQATSPCARALSYLDRNHRFLNLCHYTNRSQKYSQSMCLSIYF